MPLASTIDDFQVDPNDTEFLNTSAGGSGMDGVATFVGATQPQFGTLTDNGNGTHTYTPEITGGFDSFTVSYQSSAGNTQEFTVNVTVGNGFLAGDVNRNGTIEMDDVTQFLANWRSDTSELDDNGRIMQGDLNLDGVTNFSDWAILRQAWNDEFGTELNLAQLLSGDAPASVVASSEPTESSQPASLGSGLSLAGLTAESVTKSTRQAAGGALFAPMQAELATSIQPRHHRSAESPVSIQQRRHSRESASTSTNSYWDAQERQASSELREQSWEAFGEDDRATRKLSR